MLGFFARYKYLRHSYGFGVHSPSAYRMVREVLCPTSRYGYYSRDIIRKSASSRRQFREDYLLYRLLVDMHPSSVYIAAPDGCDSIRRIVRMALPSAAIDKTPFGAECIVQKGPDVSCTLYSAATPRQMILLDCNDKVFNVLTRSMKSGHVFRSPRRALFINDPRLPLEIFTLFF